MTLRTTKNSKNDYIDWKGKNMKRSIAIITAVILVSGIISVTSAHAGAARRHTIEGFVLGTGVAILGAAIINEINKDTGMARGHHYTYKNHVPPACDPPRYERERWHKKNRHPQRYAKRNRGHWEVERVWVEPVYEERWNPGHYNRKGRWVRGRFQEFMVQKGYWSERKIWVRH